MLCAEQVALSPQVRSRLCKEPVLMSGRKSSLKTAMESNYQLGTRHRILAGQGKELHLLGPVRAPDGRLRSMDLEHLFFDNESGNIRVHVGNRIRRALRSSHNARSGHAQADYSNAVNTIVNGSEANIPIDLLSGPLTMTQGEQEPELREWPKIKLSQATVGMDQPKMTPRA